LQTELVHLIRAKIDKHGPVSFAWFMEQTLYHPEHGYYASGRASIGRRGDYFTNVSVGPLFGRLLAAQFAEMWGRLDRSDNFTIVEQGAHDGAFARDVLTATEQAAPEFFFALRYRIIEPFPVWQDRQSKTLSDFGDRVQWRKSLKELGPFSGVHFSNELLDAMPVELNGKLVGLDGERLAFVEGPAKSETKSAVFDWIDNLAAKLERGFVVAVDYGFARAEFREVVQARAQHRYLDSPFERIGEADITMHVNWTDIVERAESNGLRVAGFTDQHHFVTGIISELLREEFEREDVDLATRRGLQTLLHPEMLGRAFQVLALEKKSAADTAGATAYVDLAQPLAGFKFARDAHLEL
jgi:SAM-dependent MidA family methyltransferase